MGTTQSTDAFDSCTNDFELVIRISKELEQLLRYKFHRTEDGGVMEMIKGLESDYVLSTMAIYKMKHLIRCTFL